MAYQLLLQSEVIFEIRDAFDWCEEQKEGLGHELIDEIEACYLQITADPEHLGYINQNYRRIKTNRFLYILL